MHDELSTVFVGGLPLDATQRECENLCRFMPGFVNVKVATKVGVTVFAQFESGMAAAGAIAALNGHAFDRTNPGEPMRVAMAKNNMRMGAGGGPPSGHDRRRPAELQARAPAPAQGGVSWGNGSGGGHASASWGAATEELASPRGEHRLPFLRSVPEHLQRPPPASYGVEPPAFGKRPRAVENLANVDTVACVGAREAGFDEESLRGYFSQIPGFVQFKGNVRMGGGFVKFVSADHATQAIMMAEEQGIPCAIAKSSMTSMQDCQRASHHDVGAQGKPGGGGYFVAPQPSGASLYGPQRSVSYGGPPQHSPGRQETPHKRPRIPENPSTIDTIACVGALEAGLDEQQLHEFFRQAPGFLTFKPNPRMGGGFAKFASAELAAQAIVLAQDAGVPAATARSSMSSTG